MTAAALRYAPVAQTVGHSPSRPATSNPTAPTVNATGKAIRIGCRGWDLKWARLRMARLLGSNARPSGEPAAPPTLPPAARAGYAHDRPGEPHLPCLASAATAVRRARCSIRDKSSPRAVGPRG